MSAFWYSDKINSAVLLLLICRKLLSDDNCRLFSLPFLFSSPPSRLHPLSFPHLSSAGQASVGTRSTDEDRCSPAAPCALPTSWFPPIQRHPRSFLHTLAAITTFRSNTRISQYTPTQTCSLTPTHHHHLYVASRLKSSYITVFHICIVYQLVKSPHGSYMMFECNIQTQESMILWLHYSIKSTYFIDVLCHTFPQNSAHLVSVEPFFCHKNLEYRSVGFN